MTRLLVAILGFCLASFAVGSAHAAKRLAFVAGIDAYDNLPGHLQLRKAVNDADAVANTLASLGYEVRRLENGARLDFLRQWQLFLNRIEPGDETAIFFAGHGVEIDGQNFLLPRDVPKVAPGEEEVLKASGLSVSAMVDQVRDRRPQMSLYVFDACRDNPFLDAKGRSIGGSRGLARVEPPSGTFIMFSAGAKESALDRLSDADPDPNSVYTRTLLPRLKKPGRITDIARDVRREVRELAASVAHVQTPAYYDEVVGEFCPAGCDAPDAAAAAPRPVAAPADAPAMPPATSETKPAEIAAINPQAVQSPAAATRAPILDCDRLAADPNNVDSVIRDRDFDDLDHAKAIPACEEAVRLYPEERRFALQLARGYLFGRQFDAAKTQLEALSRDGYPIAKTYLGALLADSKKRTPGGEEEGAADAIRLVRQGADAGDPFGALLLAKFYEDGFGAAKDDAEALRWLRRGADGGSPMAMISLAEHYAKGTLGLTKSDAEAVAWYRKAADLGSTSALYRLALMYLQGSGVARDEAEAARLIQRADERKRPQAMIEIGRHYSAGDGMPEDKAEALGWYRKAADLGDPSGMFYVGLMYQYGQGVPQDLAEAARWYRKAAELGFTTAMNSLAEMYEKGEGIAQDTAEAARWREAAKQVAPPVPEPPTAAPATESEKLANITPAAPVDTSAAIDEGLGRSLANDTGLVWSVSFSPDGTLLASGDQDGKVKLWEVSTGKLARTLAGHPQQVLAVAVSPDGTMLASASEDNTAKLWDLASETLRHNLSGHSGEVKSVAFSPDGRSLATGSADNTVMVWDMQSGKLLRTLQGQNHTARAVAFSPDGKRIFSASWGDGVTAWDAESGGKLMTFSLSPPDYVDRMTVATRGNLAATATDDVIKLWDTTTGTLLRTLKGHPGDIGALAFSPDGAFLASEGGDEVKVWEMASGALQLTVTKPTHAMTSLAFSPDGSVLAVGGGGIKLLDLAGMRTRVANASPGVGEAPPRSATPEAARSGPAEPAPAEKVKIPEDPPLSKEAAELEQLAEEYAYGWSGKPVDQKESTRLFRKVAELAGPTKIMEIAERYEHGSGVPQDQEEAARLYQRAAELGHPQAATKIADVAQRYEIGSGAPKDHAAAARLYRKAGELGEPKAMVEFGRMLSRGDGVAEDDVEAVNWYRKAVDRGDPGGMFYLALAYRFGEGVERDMAEAARWYRKAAELGQKTAMNSLAELYENGEGVDKDAAEAARWRDAAKAGQ